jgi:NitT/TauT family transport system substrate-binding protein
MSRPLSTLALCGLLTALACSSPPPASTKPAALPAGSAPAQAVPPTPAAPAAAAPTTPPAARKLTVANTSLSLAIALFVARDQGMFQRHGLQVEVPLIAGVRSVQALVAHEVEYALISGRTTTDAVLAGADLVMLASIAPTLSFVIYGAPGLTRPEDLRGKTIGVASFGGSADFAGRLGLRRFGLEPDRDYALFQTGGVPESLAALQSGGVQAAVLSAPTTLVARKAGLSPVLDVTSLGIEYVFGALSTDRAFLAQEPETTRRLLRGLLEGIHFAKTDPAATKQLIAPEYKTDDPEVLDETYALAVERMLARVPYVSPAGVKTVLDDAATDVPAARTLSPEQLIDNTWLAELEASGFV